LLKCTFQVVLNYSETADASMYIVELSYNLGRLSNSKWNATIRRDKINHDTKITIFSNIQMIEVEVGKFTFMVGNCYFSDK
jgi:hypothetical protein